jgi:hypothetical protein
LFVPTKSLPWVAGKLWESFLGFLDTLGAVAMEKYVSTNTFSKFSALEFAAPLAMLVGACCVRPGMAADDDAASLAKAA